MLKNILPPGSRARSIASCALAFVVALIYVQVVLPGTPGGGRGTPMAIVFNGFVQGCGAALAALGLVLVYRSLRLINFMQVAMGAAGGVFFFECIEFTPLPFPLALLAGVAVGALIGVAFDLTFGRRFFKAPRVVLTVCVIAAFPLASYQFPGLVRGLPIFPRSGARSLLEREGGVPVRPFLPFAGWKFHVGHFPTSYGFPEVLNIELLIFAVLGVVCFLRFTRAGVAVRALAENSERASLLGIPVGNLSTTVWAVAGGLSALSVIGIGSLSTEAGGAGAGAAIPLLLGPLVAAVIARFESIPVAIFTALLLATASNAVLYSYPTHGGLVQFAFFIIITSALLLQRRRGGRSEEGAGVAWEAVKEQRGIPKELSKIGTVRATRWALIAALGVFMIIFPMIAPARYQFLGATILLQAIIGVSLVVLTGWAGQISLAQFGFAGIGGAVAGSLTARHGWPFWFAVPAATAFTAAFATLIGLPALRLRGLFLGVTTLAFSISVDAMLFDKRYFDWLLPDAVDRPTLFFLDFRNDRAMYYLSLVCLVLAIVVVLNLRRSRLGRLLIAMRENEANVQSFGVSAVRLKLTAFAVSGALAGFSGAVFVHQQLGVAAQNFSTQRSLQVFVITVLGGIGSVGGAMLGSLYDNLFTYFLPSNEFLSTLTGILQRGGGALLILYIAPGGLIALAMAVRDAWLRIIAQRRQIVVPSLFADYDATALERRLIPLADPDAHGGLAALGPGAKFRLGSELHGGTTSRPVPELRGPRGDEERLAIGAAVAALGDVDAATPHDVVGATLTAVREDD
jgi:branched-chain amino acid transport system permease protein